MFSNSLQVQRFLEKSLETHQQSKQTNKQKKPADLALPSIVLFSLGCFLPVAFVCFFRCNSLLYFCKMIIIQIKKAEIIQSQSKLYITKSR